MFRQNQHIELVSTLYHRQNKFKGKGAEPQRLFIRQNRETD